MTGERIAKKITEEGIVHTTATLDTDISVSFCGGGEKGLIFAKE